MQQTGRWLGILLAAIFLTLANALPASAVGPARSPATVTATAAAEDVILDFFWGDGCPYCHQEMLFLAELIEEYPQVIVRDHEVYHSMENQQLLHEMAARHGLELSGVPMTFIRDQYWIGFDDRVAAEIQEAVQAPVPGGDQLQPGPEPAPEAAEEESSGRTVWLPIIGEIEVENSSLLVATIVIGLVDGINPCSLWALSVLLALVVRGGSRARIAAVGGTFLLVTATVYGGFVLGLYSGMAFVSHVGWVTVVVALAAITFGVLAVKDFFWFRAGPSMSIPERSKPTIYDKMRQVSFGRKSLAAAIVGTVGLAAGVAVLELPCTAGLPMLWANLVTSAGLATPATLGLLGVYLAMYLIEELVIVAVVVVAMKAAKLQERHGRALKLVSGWLMIALGGTLLLVPEAMESLAGVFLVLLVTAVLVAATAWFGKLRPRPEQPPSSRPRPQASVRR